MYYSTPQKAMLSKILSKSPYISENSTQSDSPNTSFMEENEYEERYVQTAKVFVPTFIPKLYPNFSETDFNR